MLMMMVMPLVMMTIIIDSDDVVKDEFDIH